LFLLALGLLPARAQNADAKMVAVLVWATNDPKPNDPNLKPVSEGIAKKLACLPFKYTNYFEVNREQLTLPAGGTKSVKMSKDCTIEVKSLPDAKFEATLIGKGKPVGKITQEVKKGKSLVTGGPAANSTAWFVVIRREE
jgi:hypothetical protein